MFYTIYFILFYFILFLLCYNDFEIIGVVLLMICPDCRGQKVIYSEGIIKDCVKCGRTGQVADITYKDVLAEVKRRGRPKKVK